MQTDTIVNDGKLAVYRSRHNVHGTVTLKYRLSINNVFKDEHYTAEELMIELVKLNNNNNNNNKFKTIFNWFRWW